MKKYFSRILSVTAIMALIFGIHGTGQESFANMLTEGWDTFDLAPVRVINVDGDAAKFRAMNWKNDGVTGGISAMGRDDELDNGDKLRFDGHVIPADNDFGASLKLIRENGSYILVDYGNFRKYYEVKGGYFSVFLPPNDLYKLSVDPELDIGHFSFEVGTNSNILETVPGVSLNFTRNTKEGIKSMTSWGFATNGSINRKIAATWEEKSQILDKIVLKGNTLVGGFNLQGEQSAEFFSGRNMREFVDSATDFQSQTFEPQAKHLGTTVKADRWFGEDKKTYAGFAYRYQTSTSDMNQLVRTYNSSNVDQSDSHNGQIEGQARFEAHSWVENFMTQLTKDVDLSLKFKQEFVGKSGSGLRTAGLGGSNRSEEFESYASTAGQSFSVRYKGIPKTSLYTDWDFEQGRNWVSKLRIGTSYTEYVSPHYLMTGVVGMGYVHNSKLNVTSQLRRKIDNDSYNLFSNNDNAIYIGRLRLLTNEWSTRVTWKPLRWLQNSVRVQLADNIYRSQALGQTSLPNIATDWLKSQATSRTYTYNLVLQPWDEWMFDFGGSLNQFKVSTPAAQKSVDTTNGGIPVYVADSYTLLMTVSYAPTEKLSMFSSGQYTRADNFDSQGFAGIPYGVNNEHYDVSMGFKWTPKEDITIEPKYTYYAYTSNPNDNLSIEYGNYSAHEVLVGAKVTW